MIADARAKRENCMVTSIPCIPQMIAQEPDAMPIFKSSGKPEAMNVSKSARAENKHKHIWTTSPIQRRRVRIPLHYGAQAHRYQRCEKKNYWPGLQESQTQVRSGSKMDGKICSFRIPHGPLSFETLRACGTPPKHQSRTKEHQFRKWQRQFSGCNFQLGGKR